MVQIGRTRLQEGIAEYSYSNVGSYFGNSYGLYDLVGMRLEYVLDRFVDQNTLAAETVDPVGPTGGTYRVMRSQHVQNGHGLRYYALAQISALPVDDLRVNYQQSYRFAIHLRPPQSFGGKWK